MKNRKLLTVACTTILSMALFVGCGQEAAQDTSASSQTDAATETVETTDELSGEITMAGSTSMEKLANAVAEAFMEKYPNVTVNAEFAGSSAGLESLAAGSVDIGNSSRNLKEEEIAGGAVENIVAIDGIAVVTDTANTVADITKEDLAKIYKGEITNWNQLGGNDEPIVVVGREAGSGTRSAFEELLEIEDACKYANELDSTGAVIAKVASTPGAIGYASLDALEGSVTAMAIEGVDATEENIKAGSYVLSRPFVMATMGEISTQSEAVQELFAYLQSEEGKEIIKAVGLITVD